MIGSHSLFPVTTPANCFIADATVNTIIVFMKRLQRECIMRNNVRIIDSAELNQEPPICVCLHLRGCEFTCVLPEIRHGYMGL